MRCVEPQTVNHKNSLGNLAGHEKCCNLAVSESEMTPETYEVQHESVLLILKMWQAALPLSCIINLLKSL